MHAYDPLTKTARHQVIGKNKLPRPTRTEDIIQNAWVPGVTQVISDILAKPALEQWKIREGIRIALEETPEMPDQPVAERIKVALEIGRERGIERMDSGSAIHDAFCRFHHGQNYPVEFEFEPHVLALQEWLGKNATRVVWSEKIVFGERYAGTCDLLYYDRNGFPRVLDYKTQENLVENGPRFYDDHLLQLGAYAHSLTVSEDLNDHQNPGGTIVVVDRSTGQIESWEYTAEEIAAGFIAFSHLVDVWYWRKKIPIRKRVAA